MKTTTRHTPTTNEILNDISNIAFKWTKETREMVFRAVNSHDALLDAVKRAEKLISDMFPHLKGTAYNTLGELREAIAKAEGRS